MLQSNLAMNWIIPKALMPIETCTSAKLQWLKKLRLSLRSLASGYGTMEELLEMITWAQLGIHKKTVGLLNVDGYYNNLLALFDTGVEEGFIKPGARNIVVSAPSARELMEKMELYTPSHKHIASHQSWKVEQLGDYPLLNQNRPQ
ncbi:unnamed protein product [Arabidopsis arenosa]|uniref:cytokinin riboside 5'-monophosphate phosphoribohydrolase n=1 Tax=Arabidopsis arenosa TaxID=38785 RepID=A0A8S2AK97_ARAAE|nr:unnamed protein product [Arabidopsis arenosa]